MKKITIVICLLIISLSGFSQYIERGTESTFTQWRQIKTHHFQVIYPKGADSLAQVFTQKLEYVYAVCSKSLKHEPRKISVILHNQINNGNGMVAWCPKQMDVYSIPPQTGLNNEWIENLAIHEFRHVVQTDKLNQGITRILSFLFGEQAVGAVSGLFVPLWFFEGDAVCTETALTTIGRGRQADFSHTLRAQLYNDGVYSYSKMRFGSYKDFVSNRYIMGYFLLANSRKTFGLSLGADFLDKASRRPFCIRPLNKTVLEKTGLNRNEWYKSIFEEQANEWKLKHDREIQTPFDTIASPSKVYTNYINGAKVNDTTYIVERSGFDRTSQLVRIQGKKEKVLANTAFKPEENRIQTNGKLAVWQETNFNVRWGNKESSYIYVCNLDNKKIKRIRTRRHVFSPAISPSNERIVVSETTEDGRNFLCIYNLQTRKIIMQIPAPQNEQIITPSWNKIGSKICFISLGSVGNRLMEFDVADESFTEILSYTTEDLANPIYWNNYILYSSSFSGVDNIYAVNLVDKQISRITVSHFGSRFPSVYDSAMVFSDYSSKGYQLGEVKLNPKHWHSLNVVRKENHNLAQMLTNQEGGAIDFSQMPDTVFTTKPYSKLLHAINIHSWMPLGFAASSQGLDWNEDNFGGVQLMSQNKLSTLYFNLGRSWSLGMQSYYNFVKVTYQGLYPIFEIEVKQGDKLFSRYVDNVGELTAKYKFRSFRGTMTVPFDFSTRSYYRQINWAMGLHYEDYDRYRPSLSSTDSYWYNSMFGQITSFVFQFYNLRVKAPQKLNSRWGQSINIGYDLTFAKGEKYSNRYFFVSKFYFPGFFRSHSLSLYGGFEKYANCGVFSQRMLLPRGYYDFWGEQENLASVQLTYSFPIIYPDFELRDFVYVKRLRCDAFVDYMCGENSKFKSETLSIGADFTIDSHFFQFVAPVNWGLRVAYLPFEGLLSREFLFKVNFSEI